MRVNLRYASRESDSEESLTVSHGASKLNKQKESLSASKPSPSLTPLLASLALSLHLSLHPGGLPLLTV